MAAATERKLPSPGVTREHVRMSGSFFCGTCPPRKMLHDSTRSSLGSEVLVRYGTFWNNDHVPIGFSGHVFSLCLRREARHGRAAGIAPVQRLNTPYEQAGVPPRTYHGCYASPAPVSLFFRSRINITSSRTTNYQTNKRIDQNYSE